jgi:DNA-directed RNA polymerase specialized sigma24 family protein
MYDRTTTIQTQQQPKKRNRNRQADIEALYLSGYGELRNALFEACPTLPFDAAEKFLSELAGQLRFYRGKLTSEAFSLWAGKRLLADAQPYCVVTDALQEHRRLLLHIIGKAIDGPVRDWSVDAEDVFQHFCLYVLKSSKEFATEGTASLRNRLAAAVKRHCWSYFVRNWKNRFRIVTEQTAEWNEANRLAEQAGENPSISFGGCAALSVMEQRWDALTDAERDAA